MVADAALEYYQDIGKAERHHQLIVSGQVTESTSTVKKSRKPTMAKLVGGVSGLQLTICP